SATGEHSELLTTLEKKNLSTAMIRVGAPMAMEGSSKAQDQDTRTISPGGRNVIFVWIELSANQPVPSKLSHQLVFSSAAGETDKPSDTTLNDFLVVVSQDQVPILGAPFDGGIWLAGDGAANDSNHRRSILAIDGNLYSPERFA